MSRALGLRGSLGLDDSGRPISSKIDEGIASLSSALCAAGRSLELATYTIDCRASAPPREFKRDQCSFLRRSRFGLVRWLTGDSRVENP
jgi:hypothetical protein